MAQNKLPAAYICTLDGVRYVKLEEDCSWLEARHGTPLFSHAEPHTSDDYPPIFTHICTGQHHGDIMAIALGVNGIVYTFADRRERPWQALPGQRPLRA